MEITARKQVFFFVFSGGWGVEGEMTVGYIWGNYSKSD